MLIGTGSHTEIVSVGGPGSMRYALMHSIVRCVKRSSHSAFRLPTSPRISSFSDLNPGSAASDSRFITYTSQLKNVLYLPFSDFTLPFFVKIRNYSFIISRKNEYAHIQNQILYIQHNKSQFLKDKHILDIYTVRKIKY